MLSLLLSTGTRAESLDPGVEKRLDGLVSSWQGDDRPGGVIGVVRDGELVYDHAFGVTNVDRGTPITTDTTFYIASTAKQFTAAAVALLAKEHKLSLDDDIRKHLPEMPAYEVPVRVYHLIHQRSGLRDFYELAVLADLRLPKFNGNSDVLQLVSQQKALNFRPGSDFGYSNSNYVLLAEIVRRVSGQSFPNYLQSHVFGPLGMTQSRFQSGNDSSIPGRAYGHSFRNGRFVSGAGEFSFLGQGGMYTTVQDLAKWTANFATGKWGGKKLVSQLVTPPMLAAGDHKNPMFGDYAFGLMPGMYRGLRYIHHSGGAFGSTAEVLQFPDQRAAIIVLSNAPDADAREVARSVADIVLTDAIAKGDAAGAKQPSVFELSTDQKRAMTGFFWDPASSDLWSIFLGSRDVALALEAKFPVEALSPTTLRAVDTAIPVEFEVKGNPGRRRLSLHVEGESERTYEEIGMRNLSPAELAEYAGKYRSPECEATVQYKLDEGRLTLVQRNLKLLPLSPFIPLETDVFISEAGVLIRFYRDDHGRISSLEANMGRARRVWFEKL